MNRRLNLLWIPLLAALLTGPMGWRPPVWAPESVIRHTDTSPAVAGLVPPVVRLQLARQGSAPADRHGGLSWPSLPGPAGAVFIAHLRDVPPRALAASFAETARHFPLFPTGPPSHG